MAEITINEISQNYTYNIGNNSYATVALPITSCWGPGFEYDESASINLDAEKLENSVWTRFPATQAGLESFVSTYRGPAAQYLNRKDFSYQQAMTLLTAGYDLLVCRVAGGKKAQGCFYFNTALGEIDTENPFKIEAKYNGVFGNKLLGVLKKIKRGGYVYWNFIVYIVDDSGTRTAVENINFVFDLENATDSILHVSEVESNFVDFLVSSAPLTDDIEIATEGFPEGSGNTYSDLDNSQSAKLQNGLDHPEFNPEEEAAETKAAHEAMDAAFAVLYGNGTAEEPAEGSVAANYNAAKADKEEQEAIINNDQATAEEKAAAELALYGDGTAENPAEGSILYIYNAAKATYDTDLEDYVTKKAAYDELAGDDDKRQYLDCAINCAKSRYSLPLSSTSSLVSDVDSIRYIIELSGLEEGLDVIDLNTIIGICRREWTFNAAYSVLSALYDKLAYNPNRVIVPGWDDQDFSYFMDEEDVEALTKEDFVVSPIHYKLLDVAYNGRCATAYIDIPKSMAKGLVYDDTDKKNDCGYAQKLARFNEDYNINAVGFYASHSALFVPWGKYMYIGTGKQNIASPSFLALVIERAMIKNQTSQYEWELPTNRKHTLRVGKMDYNISKKYLDIWQSLEGVGVNCITQIPDLGLSIWGNSTLYEVPPATYQALANLSTRKLVNAVEDLAYRCGISITFQYNNEQAYNAFYAGMTPLLDTMRNVGAIKDWYIRMAADINGLDQVNANSVVGKIYLVVEGVINNITIDLIALPPSVDLDQFRA